MALLIRYCKLQILERRSGLATVHHVGEHAYAAPSPPESAGPSMGCSLTQQIFLMDMQFRMMTSATALLWLC